MISFNYAINHKTKSLQVYSQLDIHVYIFQRLEMLSIKLLFFWHQINYLTNLVIDFDSSVAILTVLMTNKWSRSKHDITEP